MKSLEEQLRVMRLAGQAVTTLSEITDETGLELDDSIRTLRALKSMTEYAAESGRGQAQQIVALNRGKS